MSPFVYGECVHSSLAELILYIQNKYGLFKGKRRGKFYDLGSGLGKPCITAALTLPEFLESCTGYELLDSLYQKSLELANAYSDSQWVKERGLDDQWEQNAPIVKYVKQDFIKDYQEWAEGDLIFANATCFEPEMLEAVSNIADENFKPGQVFLITTNELELSGEKFHKEGPFNKQMSWGNTQLRAYIRK